MHYSIGIRNLPFCARVIQLRKGADPFVLSVLKRRSILSWCLYDVGNSAFATTIMAAVLPVYYREVAAASLPGTLPTVSWGYASAGALLIGAAIAPILGAVADIRASKKRFLALFTFLGVLASAGLWFVGPGDWAPALALYMLGSIGFSASIIFYDALLPSLVPAHLGDEVSSLGYALGYLGGGVLLAVNAAMIAWIPGTLGVRLSFVSVAVWWGLFSLPLLRNVREPVSATFRPGERSSVSEGFRRLRQTFFRVRAHRDLFVFLLAFWLYNDGVGTIIHMAAIYGSQLGIPMGQLVGALLLTQFVGVPCAVLFGVLAGRIGSKRAIFLGLSGYVAISVGAVFLTQTWHFWLLAAGVGVVQGGTQAISRSLYASMTPRGQSAEFFGFYDISGKFAGVMGPALFGFVSQATGSMRLGIAVVALTFVGGMMLLQCVDEVRGRRSVGG
jgi:UMF1 family MFS transporter